MSWTASSPPLVDGLVEHFESERLQPRTRQRVMSDVDVRSALKQGLAQIARRASPPLSRSQRELLLLHVLDRGPHLALRPSPKRNSPPPNPSISFALIARACRMASQHSTSPASRNSGASNFEVTPDVLIPPPLKPNTSIEVALDPPRPPANSAPGANKTLTGAGLQIADIGTGSGCIAIAPSKRSPRRYHFMPPTFSFRGSGRGENATRTAISRLRSHPFLSNAIYWTLQRPEFDLIASNPPYVGRREAETLARRESPRSTNQKSLLYGGKEGLRTLCRSNHASPPRISKKPAALLVPRNSAHQQPSPAVQPLLDAPTWTNVAVTNGPPPEFPASSPPNAT